MDTEKAIDTLRKLPAKSRELVVSLIEQLAAAKGVSLAAEYSEPAENAEKWATRMTVEGKSKRTIDFYMYYAKKFLEAHPRPTKLDVQAYLAGRLKTGTSPTATKGMQKSITSLFKFLSEEKLWPEDITAGLKGIKVPRTEKYVPTLADVEKVLAEGGWARKKDADKIRL